eukprot:GILI01003999.1.p2 GENE.GILI01003999.1~~GILI01003999.1.p2  ORF type:complete len:690 (-),score=205.63 GILI01003999.1:143-2212(-)
MPRPKIDWTDVDKELLDYISDDEDDRFELEDADFDRSFANVLIVDQCPIVGKDKFEKLIAVISKIFSAAGPVTEVNMPFNNEEPPMTMGFCFVTMETPEAAQTALQTLNNYRLDKAHSFVVTPMDDFDRIVNAPDVYSPPQLPEYAEKTSILDWLTDGKARDQLVMRYAEETEIYWNDPTEEGKPQLVYGGEREKERGKSMTEMYVAWSPRGTYLVTFHRPGVVVWGGNQFVKLNRFEHFNVKNIEFSPCERYLLTWNGVEGKKSDQPAVWVWDVRTGQQLRGFSEVGAWPSFKWSPDGRFLAKLGEDAVYVYETPSMKLVEDPRTKKRTPMKVEGVKDFCWSPSDNYLALWIPERGNVPARVTVYGLPQREEVCYKNLFNASDCKMHWQSNGDFLCVKVTRLTKSKKTAATTNLEVFRMRDKQFPVEMLEIKERILAFAWEPKGFKFALIHGDGIKPDVSVYTLENIKGGGKLKLVQTLESRPANHLFWAPTGGHLLIAGLGTVNGTQNGILEFVSVKDKVETLANEEHFLCSDVEWDPSGRFVITAVTQPLGGASFRYQMESGYQLWTFQGRLLYRNAKENFYQVLWRPRPPTLLSKEQEDGIKKNLKEYSKRYDAIDEQKSELQRNAFRQQRESSRSDFLSLVAERKQDLERDRKKHRIPALPQPAVEVREVLVEEVLSVHEEVLA